MLQFLRELRLLQPPLRLRRHHVSTLRPLPVVLRTRRHKEFLQFEQMFNNTIGASALSNVEKLSRLLGLLDAEPKRLLGGLLITDANYHIALDTLRRRYEDTERTARELKIELSSFSLARTTAEVRDLQIKAESLIQQLDSLGHAPASEETIWTLLSLWRRYAALYAIISFILSSPLIL